MDEQRVPEPVPFFLEAGSTGVLLIHGFTGSPPEMRRIGDYLHARDLTISAPLLPGHGTTPEDLNKLTWQAWYRHVVAALEELRIQCDPVFVAALSLGALLTLYLAAEDRVLPGAAIYSPPTLVKGFGHRLLAIAKRFIPQVPKPHNLFRAAQSDQDFWAYDSYPTSAAHEVVKLMRRTRRRLTRVTCPLLIVYSTFDETIHPRSAEFTYHRVRSVDKEIVALENSGHAVTVDSEWHTVAEHTYQFILDHIPGSKDR